MARRNKPAVSSVVVAIVIAAVATLQGCSLSPQAREARFLEKGRKLAQNKDYQRAILEFRSAAKIMPKDAEPYYRLGSAYWGSGDKKEAYFAFRKATELNPKHVGAQAKLAELLATSGGQDLVDAGKHAEAAAAISPEDPEVLYALAVTKYRLGKPEDAEQQLRKTLEKFPKDLRSSVGLAIISLQNKDFKRAEEVLKKAGDQAPGSPEPILALAHIYEISGKPMDAEAQCRRVLQLDPKNGEALLQIAGLQLQAGRKDEAGQTYKQASSLPNAEYKPVYAFFLVDQGRLDAAISEFQRLAQEDPKDRVARSRLVTAYLSRNRLDEAQRVLDAAVKANPKDTAALFQRGEVYIRLNRFAEAQTDLTRVLHDQPDRAEVHYLISEIHKARGADLLQRQALEQAIRQKPEFLEARISLAYSLLSAKQPKSALDVLDQVPAEQKQSTQLIVARNGALMAMRNNTEARKGIALGLVQSKDPGLSLQDAVLRLQQKDYDNARSSLEAILKQDPENVGALDLLTRGYIAQKQPALASQRVREQAAMRPGSFPLQMFAGNWFLTNGSPSGARAAFTVAKAADPHSAVPDINLARVDWAEGNLNGARARLSAVLAANQQSLAAHLLLALLEDSAGNFDEARTHYLKTVELDPRQAVALNGLAYVLGNHTNQLDEAFKYGQQAKELDPNNPGVDDTLGWILYRQGRYKPALEYLQSAAAKGQDPAIKYHLAMTYFKLGEVKRGQEVLDLARKVNSNLPEAALAQKVLAEAERSR